MSVAKHRLAAVSVLVAGVATLISWGRSQAHETAAIRSLRDQFQGIPVDDLQGGRKVATPHQSGDGLRS